MPELLSLRDYLDRIKVLADSLRALPDVELQYALGDVTAAYDDLRDAVEYVAFCAEEKS